MRILKKIIIYTLIFKVIGEFAIRFDKTVAPFQENNVVEISTNIKVTPEFSMIKNNTFEINDEDLRIMVIGDSYIHGGGILFEDNFSQQLKKMFQEKETTQSKTWVLDVSKPSSNTLDNHQTYFDFTNDFKPNIVILGYNFNDVEGELNKPNKEFNAASKFEKKQAIGHETKSLIGKIYDIGRTSHYLHFVISKTHRQINSLGFIIPNSKFDFNMKSYYEDREPWQKSKNLISEIVEDTKSKGTLLIFYQLPEINLLEYPDLFSKANTSIKTFFNEYPSVMYVNSWDVFKGEKSEEYRLSKYDGHPNEKAHLKMAKNVFDLIEKK